MTEDGKSRGVVFPSDQNPSSSAPPQPPPPYYYGTFQGVANHPQQPYPPPPTTNYQPPLGFPQPTPLPTHNSRINHQYHPYYHGYQSTVPGVVIATGVVIAPGTPVLIEHHPLACCGCGIGWFLFFLGFILGAVPWYVGAFILLCVRVDYREKPGLVACTLAAFLVLIAVSFGVQRAKYDW